MTLDSESTTLRGRIGEFEILNTIGYGSFGIVKHVKSTVDGKEYAMKVFELDEEDKEAAFCDV